MPTSAASEKKIVVSECNHQRRKYFVVVMQSFNLAGKRVDEHNIIDVLQFWTHQMSGQLFIFTEFVVKLSIDPNNLL